MINKILKLNGFELVKYPSGDYGRRIVLLKNIKLMRFLMWGQALANMAL